MGSINSALKEKLEYLSKIPDTEYPFISLYMNIHSHDLFQQAEKNRIFLKDYFRKTEEQIKKEGNKDRLASFKNDEEKIREYIDNNLISKAHGLAVLACDKLGIFEVFQTLMPFENSFIVDSIPHLRQLSYQIGEYRNTLVIMLDAKRSRIFNVRLGGFVIREVKTESPVHSFHKEGGWSQMRYQRHIENQVHKHYEEIAKIAAEFLDREHYENVILIGQEYEVKNFELDLPKRINMRIINVNHLQMRENINEILKTIINDLKKEEEERKYLMVQDVIERALGRGHEAIGLQNTVELAKQGRISNLVVVKDLAHEGWKCGNNLYTSPDQDGNLQCNGNIKKVELIEELIKLTLKDKGMVELVENKAAEELKKYDGVGAYLKMSLKD